MSEGRCPFLGTQTDPDTRFSYPAEGNVCHRLGSPMVVALGHQASYCLGQGYVRCPVYLQPDFQIMAAPDEGPTPAPRGVHWTVVLAGLVVIASLAVGGYVISASAPAGSSSSPGPTATSLGGFLVFRDGTAMPAGADFLTPQLTQPPFSLIQNLLNLLPTRTPTFLPTKTPRPPSATPAPPSTETEEPTATPPPTRTLFVPLPTRTRTPTRTPTRTEIPAASPTPTSPAATLAPTERPSATQTPAPSLTATRTSPPTPSPLPPTRTPTQLPPTQAPSPTPPPTATSRPIDTPQPTPTNTRAPAEEPSPTPGG